MVTFFGRRTMFNESKIVDLAKDLDQFANHERNSSNLFSINCKEFIDSYCVCYLRIKDNCLSSQKSTINSFLNLDYSCYLDVNASKINDVLNDLTGAYRGVLNREKKYFSELELIFIFINSIIQKNNEDNKINSCNFNVLSFFNIDEPLHSRLLVKLLNPEAEHGQGKLFLIEFLKLLEIETPENGEWIVTAETGRIDILIKRVFPESIIIIENKSNKADDQLNQLYRYWYQEIYNKTEEADSNFYKKNSNRYKIIYLSPNYYKYPEIHSISKPNEEHWLTKKDLPDKLPLEYEIKTFNVFMLQWLTSCINILPINNYRMIEYLKQYKEICYQL